MNRRQRERQQEFWFWAALTVLFMFLHLMVGAAPRFDGYSLMTLLAVSMMMIAWYRWEKEQ